MRGGKSTFNAVSAEWMEYGIAGAWKIVLVEVLYAAYIPICLHT